MSIAFRAFPSLGVVTLFEETAGGGDPTAPAAPRNAPAVDPGSHLDKVKFSTELDNLEIALRQTVPISHGATGTTGSPSGSGGQNSVTWNQGATDFDLLNHGQVDIPLVLISANGKVVFPTMPVQTGVGGAARYVVPFIDATKVSIHEWRSTCGSTLAAIDIDYEVMVAGPVRAASGSKLFDFDPTTGVLKLGFDRFSSDRRYLQTAPGAPFAVLGGRPCDLNNGAPRFCLPDGTSYDPVPANMQARIDSHTGFGPSMAYSGTYTVTDLFTVDAP